MEKLKSAYGNQMRKAKARGIDWEFTFETWLKWWQDSGKLELRGNTKQKPYKMCRYGDEGPYSPSNTYCGTNRDNVMDMRVRGVHFAGDKRSPRTEPTREEKKQIKNNETNRRLDVLSKYDLSKQTRYWLPSASRELGISENALFKFAKKRNMI